MTDKHLQRPTTSSEPKTGSPSNPPRSAERPGKSGSWTPGPWINCKDDFIQATKSGAVVVEQINNDLGEFRSEEITANADLIAAAPDLYEALDWFARGSHYDDCAVVQHGNECDCGVAKARAALAKARGESSVQIREKPGDDATAAQACQPDTGGQPCGKS